MAGSAQSSFTANTDSTVDSSEENIYDSDFDIDEVASSTTSISTRQYLFEKRNGRTYHSYRSEQNYVLPNDEPERDRLDIQFWAIHEVIGDYIHAPIGSDPHNILDVGTGTGLWAIDVGDQLPSAAVTGTDLSPIQPSWVPPNVTFELHDCTQYPWNFGKKFDFIHGQLINGFAIKNWDDFYAEAFQNLKPGGWVESKEFDLMVRTDDDSLPKPSAIVNWLLQWDQGAGGGFRLTGEKLKESMTKAGFVDIVVKEYKLPVGVWDKEHLNSGILTLTAMTEHIEGLSNRVFMERLGMTEEQMRQHTEPVVREWRKKSVHSYWPM
jgi:SAM-dependent methyltransferase